MFPRVCLSAFYVIVLGGLRWNSGVDASKYYTNKLHPTPVVIWHGFNSSINDTKELARFLREQIPGIYVRSLMIGKTIQEDVDNTFFMDANKQVKFACNAIAKDKQLRKGYNAVGLSQGGLFLRGVAQRCPHPPMRNLITLGSPHQGIYGLPGICPDHMSFVCNSFKLALSSFAYQRSFQKHVTQAQFWHDPLDDEEYSEKSAFLGDINNERPTKNQEYRKNLLRLKNFVMVKYALETIIYPQMSCWFGFFLPGQRRIVVKLQNLTLYKEDWLGLREMDESGRLHFLEAPGEHMHYDWTWLQDNIVHAFLLPDKLL